MTPLGTPRAQSAQHLPEIHADLGRLRATVAAALDEELYALVDLRASLLNGCAFCVDMHTETALKAGVSAQRVTLVAAWREAGDHFSEAERAVLEVVDSLTRLGENGLADDVYARAAEHLSEREMVALITAVGLINLYNRLGVGTALTPPVR